MNCGICHQPYNSQNRKPIIFPCQDEFCLKCVYLLKKQISNEIQCPVCNLKFNKNHKLLFDEIVLMKLKENLKLQENIQEIIDENLKEIASTYDFVIQMIIVGVPMILTKSKFLQQSLKIKNQDILLRIFNSTTKIRELQNKQCILFTFDLHSISSFNEIKKNIQQINNNETVMILIGLKSDLQREINIDKVQSYALNRGMSYIEIYQNEISSVFDLAISKYIRKCDQKNQVESQQKNWYDKVDDFFEKILGNF